MNISCKLSIVIIFCSFLGLKAQESSSIFNFLKIPVSSHVAALGGENISLHEDNPSLIFGNPAQAAMINDQTLGFNYMSYLKDTKVISASFTKVYSVRHTFGITGQMFSYGSMNETDETGNIIGSFSAKDMAISALYSYTMGGGWVGGATMRYIFAKYSEYSASAVGFDVGLHYTDEEDILSFGIVMKNIGAQLSSFHEDRYEHLPYDFQIGFTKGFEHSPLRFSVTLRDLTRWSNDYYFNPEGKNGFGRKLFNHVVFGVDIIPSKDFYIAAGYNFRRANELKAAGAAHGAGLSLGGGYNGSKIKLGIAWAKYHVDTSSLLLNLGYTF